jgi:hypothetical protein
MPVITNFKRGDTLIEVLFAITVFCLVSILSINLMNSGVATAQATLELTMARNEIDAQAEAIRFIANNFTSELELVPAEQKYSALWYALIDLADFNSSSGHTIGDFNLETCDQAYRWTGDNSIFKDSAFILNTRNLSPSSDIDTIQNNIIVFSRIRNTDYNASLSTDVADSIVDDSKFKSTPLYPRIIYSDTGGYSATDDDNSESGGRLIENGNYTQVARAEGIWVISITNKNRHDTYASIPEYYDFHIRTCWYAPGRNYPSTIGTIIRIYNPELIESQKRT